MSNKDSADKTLAESDRCKLARAAGMCDARSAAGVQTGGATTCHLDL